MPIIKGNFNNDLIQTLFDEFKFYDYDNTGYISFLHAKRILIQYENEFEVTLFRSNHFGK